MQEADRTTGKAVAQSYDDNCDICGGRTRQVHCKIICPYCGYTRDCSDP